MVPLTLSRLGVSSFLFFFSPPFNLAWLRSHNVESGALFFDFACISRVSLVAPRAAVSFSRVFFARSVWTDDFYFFFPGSTDCLLRSKPPERSFLLSSPKLALRSLPPLIEDLGFNFFPFLERSKAVMEIRVVRIKTPPRELPPRLAVFLKIFSVVLTILIWWVCFLWWGLVFFRR